MSEFDEEAERERLREKFEREEAKREVTERMSELLLQGATMTNAHCSECGDPIFRYDDQEFCATCERPVKRSTDETAASETEGDADGAKTEADATEDEPADAGSDGIEVTTPSGEARVRFGGQADAGADAADDQTTGPPPGRPHTVRGSDAPEADEGAPGSRGQRESERRPPAASSPATPAGSDLEETRAALQQTLRRLTQRAQSCEDPRDAEAYLSAARQAAETLGALRR